MSSLARRIKEIALLNGHFTLRNGAESDVYLDVKRVYGFPSLLNKIADELWGEFSVNCMEDITCVVGSGSGGNPLARVISSRSYVYCSEIRDQPKSYGTKAQIEGYPLSEKDRVIIPDDVFTTGGSLRETTEIVRATGAKVIGYGVVVNRSGEDISEFEGIPIFSLFTAEEIMQQEQAN